MSGLGQAVGEALVLGLWTALHPCPLATNIAAMAFLGRRATSTAAVLVSAALFTLGGMLAYAVLAALLTAGMRASPMAALLEAHVIRLVGPILILVGMVFLELLRPRGWRFLSAGRLQASGGAARVWMALPFGVLLALAFCPISAACFFVSVARLASRYDSCLLVPAAYALGTALPVIVFAMLLTVSVQLVGKAFNAVSRLAWWTQRLAGGILLFLGLYFSLKYVYGVSLP
jgi:cytochrome c-type biogenesis protein